MSKKEIDHTMLSEFS